MLSLSTARKMHCQKMKDINFQKSSSRDLCTELSNQRLTSDPWKCPCIAVKISCKSYQLVLEYTTRFFKGRKGKAGCTSFPVMNEGDGELGISAIGIATELQRHECRTCPRQQE